MEDHRRGALVCFGIGILGLGVFVVWPLLTTGTIPVSQTAQTRYGETPIMFGILVGIGAIILGVLFWNDILYSKVSDN
jgi:hypothetical protein